MEGLGVEEFEYKDEGCDLSPSCLNCPLPRCRYDGGLPANELRDAEIVRLCREGKGVREVAAMFQLSTRTIQRILRRSQNG